MQFKKIISPSLLASAIALTFSNPIAAGQPEWAEGHILVKPRAGLPEHAFNRILENSHGRAVEKLQNLGIHIVEVAPQSEEAVIKALSHNPHIEFAEKDLLLDLNEVIPNDPNYSKAWHLPKIQAPLAWEFSGGENITVAILDSGVDANHPDLSGQLISGWNTVNNTTDTSPITGHGTNVAGVVAAATNNNEGVASIAWNATLMPIRVTNRTDGQAYTSDIAEGITWAADHGADVANISFGGLLSRSTIITAAQYMRNQGGIVVISAGNTGGDPGYSDSTAIISVSATTSSDAKASWSSYGDYIDVAAPGAGIWTTSSGGGYSSVSGTSFASPATAGVVALIMAANTNLTPNQVESILEDSADDVSGTGWHPYFGSGRINAATAVQMAMNTSTSDTQAPIVNIFTPGQGSNVTGMTTVEVSSSDDQGVSKVTLYAGNQLIGSDTTAPYQFSWDSTSALNGSIDLVAYANDAANNEGTSNQVSVIVDNPAAGEPDITSPEVWFTSPTNGSTVSRTVQIAINATDDIAVANIKLYIDGAFKTSVAANTLAYSWNTRKVSSGNHYIKAIASDAEGNASTAEIQVTIGSSGGRGKKK